MDFDSSSGSDLKALLIVGAGFSSNAGLPLANEFTQELMNVSRLKLDGPSVQQVKFLKKFVTDIFSGDDREIEPADWPELEDIFTIIDLFANTGHNLGPKYSACDLRTVRRTLLNRMIRMFGQSQRRGTKRKDDHWKLLESLFTGFDTNNAVLSMNWDTVFELGILRTQEIANVDYGCGAISATFEQDELVRAAKAEKNFTIVKPHGSVNWLYCDTCRDTYWVPGNQFEKVAQSVMKEADWHTVTQRKNSQNKTITPTCLRCGSKSISTRFATFSYRKALDFPMHSASWKSAEALLTSAEHWVFFGYSMPAADFDFKALLKRVQLSRPKRPKITVITGGKGAADTLLRFSRFFGDAHSAGRNFKGGLDAETIDHLKQIGLMRRNVTL